MYLVLWILHGLIFRWRKTRLNDDADRTRAGVAGRNNSPGVVFAVTSDRPEHGPEIAWLQRINAVSAAKLN